MLFEGATGFVRSESRRWGYGMDDMDGVDKVDGYIMRPLLRGNSGMCDKVG